jgi:hypothetical protein
VPSSLGQALQEETSGTTRQTTQRHVPADQNVGHCMLITKLNRLIIAVYCIEQNTQIVLLRVAIAQSCFSVKEAGTNCNHRTLKD